MSLGAAPGDNIPTDATEMADTSAAPVTDQELLRRTASGDSEAFAELVERHRGMLWAAAAKILPTAHIAEEVLWIALARAHRSAASYDGAGPVPAWLRRIVVNEALRMVRQLQRRPAPVGTWQTVKSLIGDGALTWPVSLTAPSADTAPGRWVELQALLRQALAGMRPDFARAFFLHAIADFSVQEVAVIEGVEVGTIKSRLFRARQLLQKTIDSVDLREPPSSR